MKKNIPPQEGQKKISAPLALTLSPKSQIGERRVRNFGGVWRGGGKLEFEQAAPLALVLTRTRCWFTGQECGNMGLPCLDKAAVPCGMSHGTHVADGSQPYPSKHDNIKQQTSSQPRGQQHRGSQPHQHFATHMDPSCSLHKLPPPPLQSTPLLSGQFPPGGGGGAQS